MAEKNPFDEDIPPQPQPEPQDEQIVVEPHCKCSNCEAWTSNVDWCMPSDLKFECNPEKTKKEKIFHPLMKSEKFPGKTPKIRAYDPPNLTRVERQATFKTLVQGEVIPEPVNLCTETDFSVDVYKSLEKLNYKYSYPIQSFVWPSVFKMMNIFMIGAQKSGKTLAYLPAMGTFSTLVEEYEDLAKYKGPLVVIICSNSRQCEEVYDLSKKIYDNVTHRPRVTIMTYPTSNVHSTDILITIPNSLIHCLQTRIFNLKRLCHLVFEDASTLLQNQESSIYKILNAVDEMLQHRACNTKVQLIVTSIKWTSDLKKLLKSVYITPLVCIGNYLEAALYGNLKFEIKFLNSAPKIAYLENILKEKYRYYKTVIFCNQSEIIDVSKGLVRVGIDTIALSENSTKEDIDEFEVEWAFTQGGQYKVLLCTDFVFNSQLSINNAMWLVNYSFPETSWSEFTKRFSALSTYYQSPLDHDDSGFRGRSWTLIDETCTKQMPRILNLLGRLSGSLPPQCEAFAEESKIKSEQTKISQDIELCDALKLFGRCQNSICQKRHLVDKEIDLNDLPKSGKIRFKILNMKDVTNYIVQLVEHIDSEKNVTKINDDDLKKHLIYDENEEKRRPENVRVGKFYAHYENTPEGEEYRLCHVLNIRDEYVEVKLTTELTLQTLKSRLFEIPAKIKIIEVIFCNLIPPFNDEFFSAKAFHLTQNSLQNIKYKNMVFTGTVFLQLNQTFWINEVVQASNIDGADVIKFNLHKHLLSLKVVEQNNTQIVLLHKLCRKNDIEVPKTVKQVVKKAVETKEIAPKTAFLDDNVHEVIFSSAVSPEEFYVRLYKFQVLLDSLEQEMQEYVNNDILKKEIDIEIGKYYLALDPTHSDKHSRVKVINAENKQALVFYVDYGDEAVIDVSSLKELPSKFLTKLPFQAIQCRLYGLCPDFGEWDSEATDILYKYMLEPESDVFRSLWVESRAKDDGDKIRAKDKYSVLLKDGFDEKQILINQLMLDRGYAVSLFAKFDDFEIPSPLVVENSDSGDDVAEEEEEMPEIDDNLSDFEFVITDEQELITMMGLGHLIKQFQDRALTDTTTEKQVNHSYVIEENQPLEKATCLTPEVFWSQTNENIRLKIKLIGVDNYKLNVINKKIFIFNTTLDEKKYGLKFTFHKLVELDRHKACGQEVVVLLKKSENAEWVQLTGTSKRMRFIHYEIPDKEEAVLKKRILTLGISDNESDEDLGGPMAHVESDFDSEYDYEAPDSESD